MARYFSHGEIVSRQLPAVKDVGWLAGQIAALAPFQGGSAVLCGSVAWGTHSARSDIDIAHFGTVRHPQIEREIKAVVALYEERTKHQFIAPRIDVITVGVEPDVSPDSRTQSVSNEAGASINGVFELNSKRSTIFPDTFVRFTDHIGSLAHAKAGVWKKFLDTYLSPRHKDYQEIQREAIRSYVTNTTTIWEGQPLHALNLDPGGGLTERQLDLVGQAENYAVNLMRRMLGEMGRYPRPDRIADVRKTFDELTQPWAKHLAASAAPFFALDEQYAALIADTRKSNGGLTAATYHERLSALCEALPFAPVQEAAWEYLDQP